MSPFVAVTMKFALIFGLPPLVLAVVCHAYLPQRTKTVLAVLLVAELALFEFDFVYESVQHGTGMEMVVVPGVVLGLVVGNLLAVPIARKLRSLFNAGARQ
jgi:hypothetical protein